MIRRRILVSHIAFQDRNLVFGLLRTAQLTECCENFNHTIS
jgi:hypothetical protein